jgi:hypothetical protein
MRRGHSSACTSNLLDLNRLETIDCLVFEEAIPAHQLHGNSNADTIFGAAGLAPTR